MKHICYGNYEYFPEFVIKYAKDNWAINKLYIPLATNKHMSHPRNQNMSDFSGKKKRTVWRSPCCFTPFVPSHSSLPMHEPDYPSCMGDSDTIMVNINVHLEIFGTGTSISEVNKSSSMY